MSLKVAYDRGFTLGVEAAKAKLASANPIEMAKGVGNLTSGLYKGLRAGGRAVAEHMSGVDPTQIAALKALVGLGAVGGTGYYLGSGGDSAPDVPPDLVTQRQGYMPQYSRRGMQ